MARIIFGTYMVRYPLGGSMSSKLQWIVGLQQLGHEVYLVEKSGYPNSCFDPSRRIASDDCSYGVATVSSLLARFGLEGRWCYVDAAEQYHGLCRERLASVFRSADLFIDYGSHGAFLDQAADCQLRLLLDGEPGYTQIKLEKKLRSGQACDTYDFYYTVGRNVGTPGSSAPTAGRTWRPTFSPVIPELFPVVPVPERAPHTTIMNWQSHQPIEHDGKVYGQKNVEFDKFAALPTLTRAPLEIAVSGGAPREQLAEMGWGLQRAQEVTRSFDSFVQYLQNSAGEFSVCKNVFVETRSGWFSDKSAAYLASGRPVVLQDTGFGDHLPCGRGLFAVQNVEEAAAALDEIQGNYERHSEAARELANDILASRHVLGTLLSEVGVQ